MTLRLILASALVALLAISAVSAHAADPSFPLAGKWNSDFGPMELTESGGNVAGSYSHENGKIIGVRSGNQLTGQWTQSKSSRRCDTAVNGNYFHGRIVFDFSAKEFVGKWGFCDDTPADKWSGKRSLVGPTPCPQCPPWVSRSMTGNYLPLWPEAGVWSDPKPFNRKSGSMTVQSRFMGQKGTTCNFEVQFNNVGGQSLDERVLVGRPGKVAVSAYDHLIRIKLNPGASYAFGTEVRECPPNWGETKDMTKCAACEPMVYFAAD